MTIKVASTYMWYSNSSFSFGFIDYNFFTVNGYASQGCCGKGCCNFYIFLFRLKLPSRLSKYVYVLILVISKVRFH